MTSPIRAPSVGSRHDVGRGVSGALDFATRCEVAGWQLLGGRRERRKRVPTPGQPVFVVNNRSNGPIVG